MSQQPTDSAAAPRHEPGQVLVIGAGTMGSGIAQTFAAAGWNVVLADASSAALASGLARINTAWQRDVEQGRCDREDVKLRQSLLRSTDDFSATTRDCDLVIEAIVEEFAAKAALFRQLSETAPPGCILASNTSSISLGALAAETSSPERVLGLHFFNPVPVLPLVEVVRGEWTSDQVIERGCAIVQGLGKTPVVVGDSPGFVANRILLPMINEAVICLEDGVAAPEDIDRVMQLGMNHPLGPLALADLIGLDVCVQILQVLHHDLADDKYRPAEHLVQLVEEGRLGRKSGRGFYEYTA